MVSSKVTEILKTSSWRILKVRNPPQSFYPATNSRGEWYSLWGKWKVGFLLGNAGSGPARSFSPVRFVAQPSRSKCIETGG